MCRLVCLCTYIASAYLLPISVRPTEVKSLDGETPLQLKVKSTWERVCSCSDQDVYASVAVEGCAKESCLLLCLASVKAVYIGPDVEGNCTAVNAKQWSIAAGFRLYL